ncbi:MULTISPECIES: DUF6961 family protein [unclassified Sphingobium]|uniref:DUF6961 family protein n=1 Tax=unclassified Sphingobium TaxID=2611147 RepID=UPI000451EC91|nr:MULTISPECIES: hypothetical protein [unclassified Sphingobium]EXS68245.1 hypothetical protein BF95_26585 [Sphingobium sp. Ant17]KFL47315.1 hypothetical protein IL54_2738 [Sphingobium sp. ba1]MDT7531992.1 hypothetical protein [Sphingobium sp. SA2]
MILHCFDSLEHDPGWAEALAVERQHGANTSDFIAERVRTLALAGDQAGVARWLDVATRLDQLLDAGTMAH